MLELNVPRINALESYWCQCALCRAVVKEFLKICC